jgi:hypothetical protein
MVRRCNALIFEKQTSGLRAPCRPDTDHDVVDARVLFSTFQPDSGLKAQASVEKSATSASRFGSSGSSVS